MEIPGEFQRKDYRLTLDYSDDYEFFKALFYELGQDAYRKSTREIIEFLDKHPEIVKMNEHCEEMYKKGWESKNKLVLK